MQTLLVGKYAIFPSEKIGQGQQGVILKCQNTQTNEQCCVKVINSDSEMQFKERETEILNMIQRNPCCNVLNIYEIIWQDNRFYVFMELCNYDLDQLIKIRLNYWFSTEEIYNILGQIVNGYQHLRKYKIIHRDLKPSNLLFKELNNKKLLIKIADFGVGLIQTNSRIAITNAGTPLYQAPEVTRNQSYTDQCDIYSLGLILYKLCFHGQPYADIKTMLQLTQFHQYLQSQPFRCPQSDVDLGLIKLIEQMIVYDPSRRLTWDKLLQMQKLKPQFLILKDQYYVDYSKSLGSGMQGQTYLTFSLKTNEYFCTKVINNTQIDAQREIQIYKKIKDQRNINIIHLFDLIEEGSLTYLILEKCDENIEQYCSNKQLNDQEIIDILSQIVNGYCYLKDLEIIHRDLKPQNILIKYSNQKPLIKIIDFGVGKIVSNQNVAITMAGTPIYSAPEVLEGGPYDFQCDIFSLGAMLYQILYGKCYINPRTIQELQHYLNRLQTEPFRCPSNPQKNQDLKDLIEQMIRFRPKDRITWDQLKQHQLLQRYQKIKIISTNQLPQQEMGQNSRVQLVNNFQQVNQQPKQINEKIKLFSPVQQQTPAPQQAPSHVQQQINQETFQNNNNQQNARQNNLIEIQPLNDQAKKPPIIVKRSDSRNIDKSVPDQPINQSRNAKFDLKLALQNCFQQLSPIQKHEMDIAQYLYCLEFFFVKVSIQLESETQVDTIKYLQHLICLIEMQCLKDLILLQRDKKITVDLQEYELPKDYSKFLEEKEINNLISEIQKQQNRLKLRQNNSQDQMNKDFKVILHYATKQKQSLTVYDCLAIYQEFYRSQQKNILTNTNYQDKTRFYLEKIYRIKTEIPIQSYYSQSAQQIMCKIQTTDMINKYLDEKKIQSEKGE